MKATTTRTRPTTAATRVGGRLALPGLALVLALVATPTPSRGAPIGPGFNLSDAEAKHPILLDANGNQIRVLKGLRGPSRVQPAGATPAYVAFRLHSASELPTGYPAIQVGGRTPHQGPAHGPLRLDALAKTALDAELARTGAAAVQLPRQTYVVESLATMLGTSPGASGQIWIAPSMGPGGAVAQPAISGGSSIGDTLKGWFNDGVDAIQNLNTSITDALKKQLHLDPPKPVIYPPLNKPQTAAQMLAPPGVDAASIQPAPVPEPASLVVFAAAIAAVAVRARKRAG